MAQLFTGVTPQFFDNNGNPLNAGTLTFYQAGTTTLISIYTDSGLGTTISNPCTLDSSGYPTTNGTTITDIYVTVRYKVVVKNSAGTTLRTVDNIVPGHIGTIYDTNGNEVLILTGVASAVNEITITNAATAAAPSIAATGDNTNIALTVKGKGTGALNLGQATSVGIDLVADQPIRDSSANELIKFTKVAAAVNEVTVSNNSTGLAPIVRASGESNTGLTLSDSNSNEVLKLTSTAAAVNEVTVSNNSTGLAPIVRASGEANIGMTLSDSNSNEILKLTSTATAVNELTVINNSTGAAPRLEASGETNVDLDLRAKGTGAVKILGTADTAAELRLSEDTDNGVNYIGLKAPSSIASNVTFTLPSTDATVSGQVVKSNAAGTLSFGYTGATLIGSVQIASASASIDFTSIANSSFNSYVLVGDRIVPGTDNVNLLVRISVAGTFQVTNYVDQSHRWTASAVGQSGSTTDTGFVINSTAETIGTGAAEELNFEFILGNCAQATTTKRAMWRSIYQSSGDVEIGLVGGGRTATTSAVDGIRLTCDTGTLASGTVALYGLSNT